MVDSALLLSMGSRGVTPDDRWPGRLGQAVETTCPLKSILPLTRKGERGCVEDNPGKLNGRNLKNTPYVINRPAEESWGRGRGGVRGRSNKLVTGA